MSCCVSKIRERFKTKNPVVTYIDDGTAVLYIDRHLVHEVTSPQAFEGLRLNSRKVRHPERTLAVVDQDRKSVV